MDARVEPLPGPPCDTGENPYWHPVDGHLYWTDIPAGVLYRHDFATGQTDACYRGEPVGGFTLQADGTFLCFRVRDVVTFDPVGGRVATVVRHEGDATMTRFNDVIADPVGRVFAGTMGKQRSAGLYRVDLDGRITKLFAGTDTANGMGFSPNGATFYWTDTTNGTIDRFDYDAATGTLSNRATIHRADDGAGKPDGLAIDDAGNLWSARYGGGRVVVLDPAGRKLDELRVPADSVTCPAFGGVDGHDLFITTAGGSRADAADGAGRIYQAKIGVRGRQRFRSRIGL